jgi:glucokinase
MAHKKRPALVLAYDLGGTKLAAGVVDGRGRIVESTRIPAAFADGKDAVLRQMTDLGKTYLKNHPGIRRIGIASAGPLDPERGLLLDPTNFGGWGEVPLTRILSKALKKPALLENDAAASILAEHWVGAAKGIGNALIMTLGTGLGVGVITNGELVRAGRGLHPEGGHIIVDYKDTTAPCACGNLGCAEAYLSGRSFARRARPRFGAGSELSAEGIASMARNKDPRALDAFAEYADVMSVAIQTYVVLYAPEIVVLTGSFAAASDLFLDEVRARLRDRVARRRVGVDLLPEITLSRLQNSAGLLGGAYVALHRKL